MGDSFEKYVSMLPVDWESLVGMGVKYLARELNADDVKFQVYDNGVSIGIVTDEENIEDAIQFWKQHIEPALEGED